MKLTVSIEGLEGSDEAVVIAELARSDTPSAATLGLSLREAKGFLREVQRHLVQAQLGAHCVFR